MKNKLKSLSVILASMMLVSCGVITPQDKPYIPQDEISNQFVAKFLNYDNTFLYSTKVNEGGNAVYNGPSPVRPSQGDYEYSFCGWDKELTNIKADTTFIAQYTSSFIEYFTVTFLNYDGTELYVTDVRKGSTAVYEGEVPTKTDNSGIIYTFSGWSQNVSNVTCDMIVYAQFDSKLPSFTVLFYNYDGSLLDSQTVQYGNEVIYQGETPTKPSEAGINYSFKGWDADLSYVIGNIETTAVYASYYSTYTVTFTNYDGTYLGRDEVQYQEEAVYRGKTPTREPEGKYQYVFSGWNADLTCITHDITVIATYTTAAREPTEGFYYTWNDTREAYYITGYSGSEKSIYINDEYNGHPVKGIADSAFQSKTSLTSVYIEEGIDTIGDYAFSYCSALKSIRISNYTRTIGKYILYESNNIDCINIPSVTDSISSFAFKTLKSEQVTINKRNANYCIYEGLFMNANKTIVYSGFDGDQYDDLYIPTGVNRINDYAFYGIYSLNRVTFPDSLTAIGSNAFERCTNLKDVCFNEGLSTISSRAFVQCNALTKIELPYSITALADDIFNECYSIEEYVIDSSCQSYTSYQGCLYNFAKTSLIFMPYAKEGTLKLPYQITYVNVNNIRNSKYSDVEVENNGQYYSSYKGALYNGTGTYLYFVPKTATSLNSNNVKSSLITIGNYSIYLADSLTEIDLSNTKLTTVESFGIYSNNALVSIKLPSTVSLLANYAISLCGSLSEVSIPCAPTTTTSFIYSCDKLTKLEIGIPSSITNFSSFFVYGSIPTSLTEVVIASSTQNIPSEFFSYCNYLTKVSFADSVKTIGSGAFMYCYNLKEVDCGNGLTTVGSSAFLDCTSLTSLKFPESLTSVGGNAFQNCTNLKECYIPDYCVMSEYSFAYCGISSFDIPYGTTEILNSTFYGCSSLKSITIPSTVKKIGPSAFSSCSSLKSITIPSSVTSIDTEAFYNCSSLSEVKIEGEGLKTIGDRAFYYCPSLESINFPSSLTSVGENAFQSCTSLSSISFPSSLTKIGNYAFRNCSSLTGSITIPSSVTYLGYYAFDNTSISKAVCNQNCSALTNNAFSNCSSLSSVTLNNKITSIESGAFNNCVNLSEITMSSNITSISEYAFYYCSKLKNVSLPSSVNYVGSYAFAYSGLSSFTSPTKLTSIPSNCFYHSSLETLTLSDNVSSIGSYAFAYCSSLKTVTLSSSLTSIGSDVFSGSSNISYTMSDGGRYLGTNTNSYYFLISAYDNGLDYIKINSNCVIISSGLFGNNCSYTKVVVPKSVKTSYGDYYYSWYYSVTFYFEGTKTEWQQRNPYYTNQSNVYYYQKTKPTSSLSTSQLWYYGDDGEPLLWKDYQEEVNND